MKDQKPGLGSVSVDGEFATITFERRYAHPIERVWRAITPVPWY